MTTLGPRLLRDDAGSVVLGWLSRIVLILTALGIAAFEVLSIAVAHISLEDVGRTASDRALTKYAENHDSYQAYLAADEYVTASGATLVKKSFEISSEAVSFEVKKTAPTLLLFRLDSTAGLAEVHMDIYQEPIEQGGSMP